MKRTAACLLAATAALLGPGATARAAGAHAQAQTQAEGARPVAVDPKTGKAVPRRQLGKASIYANKFANRKMANGKRMDPRDDNAASKTLPLGTKAQVTNLETGRSAVVTIEDRGPYVKGRVVDLSPATAEQIGLDREQGLAPVEVKPLAVPRADGTLKPVAEAD